MVQEWNHNLRAIDDNELTGELPPELGNLSNLKRFWATSNSFNGTLSERYANLKSTSGDIRSRWKSFIGYNSTIHCHVGKPNFPDMELSGVHLKSFVPRTNS
ncbi:hypothetical protein Q3G72_007901 [Acer saccharum]|nr:hypothetical protein Q3G72_007901 [Acer saccharum]